MAGHKGNRALASNAKNFILLENYYLPGDLEAQINGFVAYYNHRRYHESIDNLTPADVYFGRGRTILWKEKGLNAKPSKTVAYFITNTPHNIEDALDPLLDQAASCLEISDDGHSNP